MSATTDRLRSAPPPEILRDLAGALGLVRVRLGDASMPTQPTAPDFPEPPQLGPEASIYDSVYEWTIYAAKLLAEGAKYPQYWLLTQLQEVWRVLRDLWLETVRLGYNEAADMIKVLADRVSAAIAEIGKGYGQAAHNIGEGAGNGFKAFWGLTPSELLGGGAVVGLVALGMGIFLLTTPGGQAYLTSGGAALVEVGRGYGQALPELARQLPTVRFAR